MKLRWKFSFSKIGTTFGLTLALSSVLAAGVGTILIGKRMVLEDRAYIQQSIGDTSSIIGKHFKVLFDLISEELIETGMTQLRPLVAKSAAEPKTSLYSLPVGTLDTNSDIMDLSLWKRGVQSSAFDLYPVPKRVYLAMNTRFSGASSELVQQIQAAEGVEKTLVQPAFQGHSVVSLASPSIGQKGSVFVAIPFGRGAVDEVIVAHLQVQRLQDALLREGLVSISLVDDFGNIIANPDMQLIGKKVDSTPLFQAMHASKLLNGQLIYEDQGVQYLGGYSRVGIGQLAVLARVPESEVTTSVKVLGKQTALFLISCFLTFFIIGYAVYTRTGFVFYERRKSHSSNEDHQNITNRQPRRVTATVLYGSLRQLSQILELSDPEESAEAINDFFNLAQEVTKIYGGLFERVSGHSFIAIWGVGTQSGTEVWCAMRSGLDLRKHLSKINSSRKVDGQKPISIGMGIHTGVALAAKIGPSKNLKYTIVGEVIRCAKYLGRLSETHSTDILVSQESWLQSDGKFIGETLGEAKLTQNSGLMGYFSVSGYRNEQGEAVTIEMSRDEFASNNKVELESGPHVVIVKEKTINRWLVNNGSQIVGPLLAKEIATRLFAQELDFDCECWAEGTGNSAQIRNAGIFSGSEDPSATLWLYDGETVHGPVNAGFIRTAIDHGALKAASHICEGSTIHGWISIEQWQAKQSGSKKVEQDSANQDALRASLAPPTSSGQVVEQNFTEKADQAEQQVPPKKVA